LTGFHVVNTFLSLGFDLLVKAPTAHRRSGPLLLEPKVAR
jgi:hypothetical protein